jgi:hypothetical protein
MARVWRQGQRKRVWIYRLLTTGSIEEKVTQLSTCHSMSLFAPCASKVWSALLNHAPQVYQRQLAKQGLSAAIVDSAEPAAQTRTFSQEELRALFEVGRPS